MHWHCPIVFSMDSKQCKWNPIQMHNLFSSTVFVTHTQRKKLSQRANKLFHCLVQFQLKQHETKFSHITRWIERIFCQMFLRSLHTLLQLPWYCSPNVCVAIVYINGNIFRFGTLAVCFVVESFHSPHKLWWVQAWL